MCKQKDLKCVMNTKSAVSAETHISAMATTLCQSKMGTAVTSAIQSK